MHQGRRYAVGGALLVAFVVGGLLTAIAVARGGSTSDFNKVPPSKQTFEAEVHAQDTAAAQVPPDTKDPSRHTVPTPGPPQPVPTGIIEHPNSFMRYTFANAYQQVVGDRLIEVHVGAEQDDPSQGVVVVTNRSRVDLADVSQQSYRATEKTGSLRIVSGDLSGLDLVSTNGTAYVFDATNGVLSLATVPTPVSAPVPALTASAQ